MHLGLLKNTLLNSNPAFSEKSLGYSSFLQFINSIDSVKTRKSETNLDWFAEINNDPIKTQQNNITTQKTATVETYTRILRDLQWRLVSKDTIVQLHARLRFAPENDLNNLTEYLLQEMSQNRPDITTTEIKKQSLFL